MRNWYQSSGTSSFCSDRYAVDSADGVECVENVPVVDSVLSLGDQLALELHSRFGNFKRVREQESSTRGSNTADKKFHHK